MARTRAPRHLRSAGSYRALCHAASQKPPFHAVWRPLHQAHAPAPNPTPCIDLNATEVNRSCQFVDEVPSVPRRRNAGGPARSPLRSPTSKVQRPRSAGRGHPLARASVREWRFSREDGLPPFEKAGSGGISKRAHSDKSPAVPPVSKGEGSGPPFLIHSPTVPFNGGVGIRTRVPSLPGGAPRAHGGAAARPIRLPGSFPHPNPLPQAMRERGVLASPRQGPPDFLAPCAPPRAP